jgi:hypothetical protein
VYNQAAHVARNVHDGLLESPIRPLADTLMTIRVIDEVRHQLGISFTAETQAR